jgi:hypothetical protein
MNLAAISNAIEPAVRSDDLFEACRIMDAAAGLTEPFVARRFERMSIHLATAWYVFDKIEDRAESLKHWLIVEQIFPTIKINSKRIPQAPA